MPALTGSPYERRPPYRAVVEAPTDRTVSWRTAVAGFAEVFHAQWHDHAYPGHAHHTWTLPVVDDGVIGCDLDRHDHTAVRSGVTRLPPHVVHP
ncbi:hypothetical protein [Terrabacter terrigena]|uniref:AraC family transcriptional regulator n=1 Tax=Terrabacter terrigena TaxID=574718 RepID=A0ABW3N1U4_9MICO